MSFIYGSKPTLNMQGRSGHSADTWHIDETFLITGTPIFMELGEASYL